MGINVLGTLHFVRASPHYVASGGGVNSMMKWLTRRAAPDGVRINAIAPGPVQTPMTTGQSFDALGIPLGRVAQPDEIAWPIAFLCSSASSYMTGNILDVNGGVFRN